VNLTLCSNSRDDELLAAVAQGDRDAFAELYDRFAPHVCARVRDRIADSRLADDAVLRLFVEFWRQAPRLNRARADVATWLSAMAHVRPASAVNAQAIGLVGPR